MRYLILSDIHGNREALDAVLEDARGGYDRALCCGDLCDYGPDPDYAIEWGRRALYAVIRGNHDRVCSGLDTVELFTPLAQASARWTMEHLKGPDRTYLRELPQGPLPVDDCLILVHGSPDDEDEYVTNVQDSSFVFAGLAETENAGLPYFFGHTHLQGAFVRMGGRVRGMAGPPARMGEARIGLEPDAAYLINPGSVGQPRDGDPRAAYAIFDAGAREVLLRRAPYDYEATERKILAAGLPPKLGLRLAAGR